MDFQNVLQDLPLFVNYARIEDFQTAQRPTDRGGGGIVDFKKLVIAKYGKISAAQKVRNWHLLSQFSVKVLIWTMCKKMCWDT